SAGNGPAAKPGSDVIAATALRVGAWLAGPWSPSPSSSPRALSKTGGGPSPSAVGRRGPVGAGPAPIVPGSYGVKSAPPQCSGPACGDGRRPISSPAAGSANGCRLASRASLATAGPPATRR